MSGILNFNMQHQEKDEWCWAACASSVAVYLQDLDPGDAKSQCQIVQACLAAQTPICAANCQDAACDQTYELDEALRFVNHLDGDAFEGYPTFQSITEVILNLRVPIGVRRGVDFSGHFVLIVGFDDENGAQDLFIADPLYATDSYSHQFSYSEFCHQSDGVTWTHTYPIR
jgi:hypothetical protein